jgi:uncharacterized protein YndB with AHSA1/START domain
MNLADNTAPSQSEAITFDFELPHPLPKVWRALTEPELLSQWLLPVLDLKLEPGAIFSFRTQPHPGWDGTVNCRMLAIEPPHHLSYRWVVGEALDTVVSFTLAPAAAGTHLRVVQSGFKPDQKQNFGGARYGWKMMGGKLGDLLGRIP